MNIEEFIVYYKTEGQIFRAYNSLSGQINNLGKLPRDIPNFYLPKKNKKYIADDESLKKYAEDLYKDKQELLKKTGFNYFYYTNKKGEKIVGNHSSCIERFFKMYPTKQKTDGQVFYKMMERITPEEVELFKMTYNGYLQYINKGEHTVYGYDYKGFYQCILDNDEFIIPMKAGKYKTIKNFPKDLKFLSFGFIFVKISCDNEDFKKIFMFSKDNCYTTYSVKFALKYQTKYNVNIEIIQKENNAYFYKKKDCIPSKKIFERWSKKLNQLKKDLPNNGLIKMLSASLWGHLSRKKKFIKTEDEVNELNNNNLIDLDNSKKYKILDYITDENNNSFYKVLDVEQPYFYNFRLKSFITSYGRNITAELAIKMGLENVVRICCDSVCSTKSFNCDEENKINSKYCIIPETKSTGKFIFNNVNQPLLPC